MSSDSESSFWTGVICFFFIAIFGTIMGGMVCISDVQIKKYKDADCIANGGHLDIHTGTFYAKGTLQAYRVNEANIPVQRVELFYPPNRWWLLVGKETKDVKNWAAPLRSGTGSFSCFIQDIKPDVYNLTYTDPQTSRGVSTHLDNIGGWWFFFVLGLLCLTILLGCMGYFLWDSCCKSGSSW